jgi:hypothetical protein
LYSDLLEPNAEFRLGTKKDDVEVMKNNDFFIGIDWQALELKQTDPPFVPDLAHDHDTSYIDRKLTSQTFNGDICETVVLDPDS